MKIAIVQEQIDLRRGGAETSVIEMARRLVELGQDVTLVVAEGGGGAEGEVGVKIAEMPIGSGSKVVRAIRFVAQADRYCRENDFKIIHAVTPCFSCNVYQPRGGTYVETVNRSVARAGGFFTRLIKRLGRRFNRRQRFLYLVERGLLTGRPQPYVAAVSEYVARQVYEAFPQFPKRRVRVIFNGVDLESRSSEALDRLRAETRAKYDVSADRPLLLFVAHNFKLKGLRELIDAMALPALASPNALPGDVRQHSPLLFVLGRDRSQPYERQVRRLGLEDRVRFIGPASDLTPFYAAADVLVHPTWYDPCSRVVLEALGVGLPVVTTRVNGASEVMAEGTHGVVVDSPADLAASAQAIFKCMSPELRAACRAAAPAMRERLSMARHARELVKLYEEIQNC